MLQSKLDLEDELKSKFDKEKKRMLADFELRLKEELDKMRKDEEKKKEKALQNL